jgi:hypothetical protein
MRMPVRQATKLTQGWGFSGYDLRLFDLLLLGLLNRT